MKEEMMPTTTIRHRGYFDYDKLINTWQAWFGEQGFTYPMGDEAATHPHKIGDFGWEDRGLFYADKKVSEYVRFRIDLRVVLQNMREVEVVQDGKKRKLTEGLVLIEVIPFIQFDYQGRFDDKGDFVKNLGAILKNYILKYKIGDYWEDMLMDMSTSLVRAIRTALEQEIL